MQIRYYADSSYEDDHETVLDLLREINEKWEIPVEIVRIRERHGPIGPFPGEIREDSIEDAFENDFEYNRDLSANTGHTPKDAYQTKSGLITIAGSVGIVDPDLKWATMLSGEPPDTHSGGADDTYTISFLRSVLERGRPTMEEKLQNDALEDDSDGITDHSVLSEFVKAGVVEPRADGNVYRGVTVGSSTLVEDDLSAGARRIAREVGTRSVGAVIEADRDWVLEVRDEFNGTTFDAALGQAVVGDALYRADEQLDPERTQAAVLFGSFPSGIRLADEPQILAATAAIAGDLGVEVFVGVDPEGVGTGERGFFHLTGESERLQQV